MLQKRSAFTMIELLFVIVIIGILASIAIPKLSASRNDAQASMCVRYAADFITASTLQYANWGYSTFKDLTGSDFTNISTFTGDAADGVTGFTDTALDSNGVDFYCEGDKILNIIGNVEGVEYNLTLSIVSGDLDSPAADQARDLIVDTILNDEDSKVFSL